MDNKNKPILLKISLIDPCSYTLRFESSSNFISKCFEQRCERNLKTGVNFAVKSLLNLIFPPSGLDYDEIQKNIKNKVETLCQGLIDKERVISLEKRLQGLKNALYLYELTSYENELKKGYLPAILLDLAEAEPDFLDYRNPERTIPYFVQMGTIYITMLREEVVNYEKIYHTIDVDRERYLKILQDKIQNYTQTAQNMLDKAKQWRENQISQYTENDSLWSNSYKCFLKDQDSMLLVDYINYRDYDAFVRCDLAYNTKKDQIMQSFMYELNMVIAPAFNWKYFDIAQYPDQSYDPQPLQFFAESQLYGYKKDGQYFDDMQLFMQNGPITQIRVRSGVYIDSLQMTYGNIQSDIHGGSGGGDSLIDLTQRKINKVQVKPGDIIDGLIFYSSDGNQFTYGKYGNFFVTYDVLAPGPSAYLAAIRGTSGTFLYQIQFVWVYQV
eukprot:403373404